ncbi:hypothetical protein D1627_04580 [Pontibacter oryzae]|uniref:Uncharacterized protein n=1 Tax=Pontibacter oryzae TaxID=2304593 RepID=A0A399SIT0_9BACT|nr:hypothetical protein D1627_04580 [Pontibacter oryzae]
MENNLHRQQEQAARLQTECGRTFSNVFRAIKLVRDEKHNFHIIYKTYQNEFIYTFCDPFQESDVNLYQVISEQEARNIFLPRLSTENALELFSGSAQPISRI